MQNSSWRKAGILTFVIVVLFIGGWEMYLRSKGITVDYDDGDELWSQKRAMVYEPADKATVFIGSSRNKYDLDIDTWEAMTGDHAIQLAIEGASPLPVLDDLAEDKNFKGKLVIDLTEVLFFSTDESNLFDPKKRIAWSKKVTPAQRFSFHVNHLLESKFVFLDKYNYSLNGMLDKLEIPSRKGVFAMPIFPMDFGRVKFSRQDYMTDKFLADTNLQNKVKSIWVFFRNINTEPPASGHKLDSIVTSVRAAVNKIKARGGQVLFVRTPSSGPFLMGEKAGFPRTEYWERVLAATGCPGIHFEDYTGTANLQCPEFSHLKPVDAVIFTRNVVEIMQKEKGWVFPHAPSTK